jgi:ADP-heptose:LPS heptosyltransferase
MRPDARPIAVIVEREGLGDALLKLPLLRALAHGFPGRPIWWLANFQSAMADALRPYTASLVAEVRTHQAITKPFWRVIPKLRAYPPFSLVFDTRGRVTTVWTARTFLNCREYYCCIPAYLFAHRRPPGRWARPRHIGERALSMAEAALQGAADYSGKLECGEAARAAARALLPDGRSYVGLAVGSREARKNWPLPRYAALARLLLRHGHVPVLLVGPQERAMAEEVRSLAPGAIAVDFNSLDPRPAIGELDGAIAVAERLAVLVANDSGLGHLFGSAGRPVVSLFGPTDPRRWAPFAPARRILRTQDYGGEAMEAIPERAVMAAVAELLAENKPSA